MTPPWTPTVEACDTYLRQRTGIYEYRRIRYNAAIQLIKDHGGLQDDHTIIDVGAGWTELDYCLRAEHNWRGRYIPIDGGIDGTDLNTWIPPRQADWIIGLEIIEHLTNWEEALHAWCDNATKGVIVSTPNPRTTDVLGMDHTHVVAISYKDLWHHDFWTTERSFYGNIGDSILGLWRP